VNAQLYTWRDALAASTVNHRLDALSNFFAVLDPGRSNPVAGAVRFKRPPRVKRWVPLERVDRVRDRLPKTGKRRKTYARCVLMRSTGMRPPQMARLSVDHFGLAAAIPFVIVPAGKGGYDVAVPLTPEGVDAALVFLAVAAFGSWSTTSATRLLTKAAAAIDVPRFTVYQIRHSFLRRVRECGADLDDVRELAGHTDTRTTAIYAPIVDAKLVAAVMRLSTRAAERRMDGGASTAADPAGKMASS
jgi:integrase